MRALGYGALGLMGGFALLLSTAGCWDHRTESRGGTFEPDSVPDAYRLPIAALMGPGATRAFEIGHEGDLYNGEWAVRVRPSANGEPAGAPHRIAFEDRWRPVARWTRRSGPVRWDFEAVALPEIGPGSAAAAGQEATRDSGLLVSLEVRAMNLGPAPCDTRLELAFEVPDSPAFVAFDAPVAGTASFRWASEPWDDPAHGWTARLPAHSTWTLEPGRWRAERYVLPAYPMAARRLASWARTPHSRRVAEARKYWNREVGRSARFELGDPEVENALRAALVVLLSCRERRGGQWVPIGGPFHYRDVWLRDGARAVHALSIMGRTREARELVYGLADYQWPQGPFVSQRGQLDGTGQALWAFEQALLRPAVDDSVGRFARAALRAWRWLEWQRELGLAMAWPFGAMLPFGDPRDNERVRAQLVGNDVWAIAGYGSAARLLRAAGRTADAESVEVSRARYREDFLAALERSGSPDLPPSWQGVGRDWGNLTVAYPCAVLPASDPRSAALARRVWSRSGGAGLCSYAHSDSLHSYLGADLGTWALLAGERAAADSVLAAMLAWRTASGTAGELFSRRTADYGLNPPPHPSAAAGLVALIRNSVVFDEGDTLRLTLGARAGWWRNGRVHGAPTRWGNLDLQFRRRGPEATWRWTPVRVWTVLRLPPGTRIAGALPPPLAPGATDDAVLAPPGTGSARVALADVEEPGS